jgi:hypothetical protein
MMGTKQRRFDPLPRETPLEDLVPKDHFYRRLEERLDLSFVRELVAPLCAGGGRPSVDPVVFFKLQLVMLFEDLRSKRQLMRVVADRARLWWAAEQPADYAPSRTAGEEALFASYGRVYTPEDRRRLLGTSGEQTGRILAGIPGQPGREKELVEELRGICWEGVVSGARPMPGAVELVEDLRGRLPLGVAS